eukprot:g20784.t1
MELLVGRSITGFMFINNDATLDYVMSVCGIKIYKAFTSTTTTTTAAAGGVEDLAAVPAEFAENCVRETRRMGRKNLLNTAAADDYVVESDGPLSSPYLPGVTTMVGCLQWCAETKTCGGARCGGAAGSDQPLNCDQLCGGVQGYCAACDSVDGALRGLCCRSGLEAGVLTGSTSGDCAAVPAANYITSGYGQCVYVESKWRLASHVVASSEAASNPLESAFDREPFGALFHNNFLMPSYESVDRCPGIQIDLGAVKEVSRVRLAHPARLGRLRRAYFRSMVNQNWQKPNHDGAIETTSPELNSGFQVAVTDAAKFPSTGGNCAVDATTGEQNANCVALAAQSDCFSFDASAELCEEVKYNGVDFLDGWRMIGYQTKAMPSNDANDALLDRVLDCGGKRGRYVHLLHPGSSSSHAGFAMSITEFGVFSHRCDTTDYDDATYSLAPPGAAVCPQNLGVTVFGDFCRDAVRLLARRLFDGKAPSGEEDKLYTGQSHGEEKCGAPRRGREATDGNALWRHKPLGCSMDLTNYTAHFRTGDVGLGYVDNADCAANRRRYSLVCMRLKEGQTYSLGAGASC